MTSPQPHTSTDLLLARYRMPELPQDFYPATVGKLLPLGGYEYQTPDFRNAIRLINSRLNLRFDELQIDVLGLMSTGLSQANRFRKDIHIAQRYGENSSVHSCHSAILMTEMFRRAGLLESSAQTAEIFTMRVTTTIGCLVHDMGEILGEFNSVAQRTSNSNLAEDPDTERGIFECALRLAYQMVLEQREYDFYDVLKHMREDAGVGKSNPSNSVPIPELLKRTPRPAFEPQIEESIQLFLQAYDLAELKNPDQRSNSELFMGYAVKAIEHMQGTRHFTRFSTKDAFYQRLNLFSPFSIESSEARNPHWGGGVRTDETLPLSLSESRRMLKNVEYVEGEIGHLFKYATTPAELALARTIRDSTYQTIIEWFNASGAVIDRRKQEMSPLIREVMDEYFEEGISSDARREKLRLLEKLLSFEAKELLAKVRSSRSAHGDKHNPNEWDRLEDIETKGRIMSLYQRAIEADYRPAPGEILLKLEQIPAAIGAIKPVDFRVG